MEFREMEKTTELLDRTDQLTIDECVELFAFYDQTRAFEWRRYQACVGVFKEAVAIADVDDNGSNLTIYEAGDFVKWMNRFKANWQDETFENDLFECFHQANAPEPVSHESH